MKIMRNRKAGLGYFLSEGFRSIITHGFMSFAAITVIAACLLVTATFGLVAYNIDLTIEGLSNLSEIIIYVDESLSQAEAMALEQQVAAIDNVDSVTFVSKEEFLDQFIQSIGEDGYLLEDLHEDNPLRDSFRVTMVDISRHADTVLRLRNIDGIASSKSDNEVSERLVQIRRVVNIISYTLVALLGGVSIFIISNTVKLALFSRREEIAIMKMVGATNGFIRAPFAVEGIILGLLAALLAFFVQWGVYAYIVRELSAGTAIFDMVTFSTFSSGLLGILLLAGAVIGVSGSILTIRKFLKV